MIASPLRGLVVVSVHVALLLGSTSLMAGPEGGTVVRGKATIATTGDGVTVTQTSKRAVIDWRSFSIDAGETVRFQQPSARSLAVNRVTGGEASTINGSLQANGRVMLSNPAGITFGRNAKVDVAGLVATTARLADRDLDAAFDDDRFHFEDAPPGSSVVNEGDITVAGRGLVALVAPWVANRGKITARVGTVQLASGSAFTVDFYGDGLFRIAVDSQMATALGAAPDGLEARVGQSGEIIADAGLVVLEVSEASSIVDSLINMDGTIEANSLSRSSIGEIVLHGRGEGTVTVAGTLDATGVEADRRGGDVFVLGNDIRLRRTAKIDVSGDALAGAITFAGGTRQKEEGGTRQEEEGGFLPVRGLDVSDRATLRLDNLRSGEPFKAYTVKDGHSTETQPGGGIMTVTSALGTFTLGIQDAKDPAKQVPLLQPGMPVGADVAYQVLNDGTVFVDGTVAGRFQGRDYDVFVRSADGGAVPFDSRSTEGTIFDSRSTEGTILASADPRLYRLDGRLQGPQGSAESWNPRSSKKPRNPRGGGDGPNDNKTPLITTCPPVGMPCVDPTDTEQCNNWRQDQAGADAEVARCYAALALAAIAEHATTSFAALLAALDDPSPISRARAVRELGEIGAYLSAAVPVLIEAMVTADGLVARLAERVLKDADGFARDVVPALGRATVDPDERVVRNAAFALGDLGAYATAALPVLDETLLHPDVAARFNAAQGITKVDAEMRATTLALARLTAPAAALDDLEDALAQNRSPFRTRAVSTLAEVVDAAQTAARATRPGLTAADPAERVAAVTRLGELDRLAAAAQPLLIQAVALPESGPVRDSLVRLGSEPPLAAAALDPLLFALNDRDPGVRAAAAQALQELAATASRTSADLARLPREEPLVRRLAGQAEVTLAGFAPAVLPRLEPAAGDEDPAVRGAAVGALGHLGPAAAPAVPVLVAALAGDDAGLHRPAARSLGQIGVDSALAVPALADRLFDSDPRVACESARALGLFGEQATAAAPQLLAAAARDQDGPGFCAGVALLAVDPPAAAGVWSAELADLRATVEVEAMLEAVKGPALLPRESAMPVGPNAVAALPALVEALATAPESDRAALAILLTSVAEEVRDEVPWLARELAEGDIAARSTAVRLLGRLTAGTNAAAPGLVDGLDHPDQTVRLAMVRALSLVTAQTTAATQALLAVALDDSSTAVRADATASLRQLAMVQQAVQGTALVAEVPMGRAGQPLVRFDRRLAVTQ